MDWCLSVYEEWRTSGYTGMRRTLIMFLAVLIFCAVLVRAGVYAEPAVSPAEKKTETVVKTEAVVNADAPVTDRTVPEPADLIDKPDIIPDMMPAEAEVTEPQKMSAVTETPIAPAVPAEPDVPAVPETPIVPDTPAEPDVPAVPETPIVPDTPAEPDVPAVPDIPAAPAVPDETDEPEDTTAPAGTIGGFLVDENGIIYGVSDPELAISGGVMKFPAEGCVGIRAGAFSAGFSSVLEVYIPANITQIEAGAFTGLTNAEWYTAEPGSGFSDNMGVLLSDNGTRILAFPAGRTGWYRVPAGITGFAENAFADAKITEIDMTECMAEVPADLPGHIEVVRVGLEEAY